MKGKLFAVFIMASLFFSCIRIEDLYIKNSNDAEITFNTNSATKAIVDTTRMIDHFGVYGYVVPGNYSNGGYLMKNAEYDENGDAVSGPYYWPVSDNNTGIDFIFTAYSQFESAPIWENDTLKLAVPALTQALIDNPDDFDDVLWAQTVYNHHQNSLAEHERVNLNFKHALSWIQFRGEVTNANIKWAKVKQISFGEYRDSIPGTPGTPYQPAVSAVYDTTYRVKFSSNIWNRPGGNISGLDDAKLEFVNSLYTLTSLDGTTVYPINEWPTSGGPFILKVNKDLIPAAYKRNWTIGNYTNCIFFDYVPYFSDNNITVPDANFSGYDILIHIKKNTNGTYTGVKFSAGQISGSTNSLPIITEIVPAQPEVPATPATPGTPAHGSEGLYVDGLLCLPTKDTLTTTPVATYGTQKDTTLNYVSAQVDTIFTNAHEILGNALVIPQPVPQNITVVFDICIVNPNGDEVVFTDRKITRTINTGKDMVNVDYTPSWAASNKYIYNFNFNGETLDFSVLVSGWTLGSNDYHVWKY